MGHSYQLLIDENVEPIDSDLRAQGHDVKRVENVPQLGVGADDQRDIVPYLQRAGRIILTYDSHFTGEESVVDPTTLPGVLFVPDESLSPNQLVRILAVMAEHIPPDDLDGCVQHVTSTWLNYE